jgi:hypothetical protein
MLCGVNSDGLFLLNWASGNGFKLCVCKILSLFVWVWCLALVINGMLCLATDLK